MKRRDYIALIMAASMMLASCGKAVEEEPTTSAATTAATVAEETTVDETTDETTAQTTVETDMIPDPYESGDEFMTLASDFATENTAADPEALYSIALVRVDGNKYSILLVRSGDSITPYCKCNDELVIYEDTLEIEADAYLWITAEDLCQMPFVYSLYNNATHTPSLNDTVYAQSVADGVYFGEMIGISEDCSEVFISVGEAYIVSESYVESLEVGDEIGVPGYFVTAIENGTVYVWNETMSGPGGLYFSNATRYTDDYILVADSDNPFTTNNFIAVVPVSDDVVIDDSQMVGFYPDTDYEADPDDDSVQGSLWYYVAIGDEDATDGWHIVEWLIYPISIENGEVIRINPEVR